MAQGYTQKLGFEMSSREVIDKLSGNDPSLVEYTLTQTFNNKKGGYAGYENQSLLLSFCKALQSNTTLKKLQLYSIQGGSLDKDCVTALGQALSDNKSLELLVLDGNGLTNVVKEVLSGNSTLTTIGLFGKWVSNTILKRLKSCSNITSLHLGGTGKAHPKKGMLNITEKTIHTLQQCSQLEQIQFICCNFEKGSIKNVSADFAKKVKIDSDSCTIDDQDMLYLEKLQSNTENGELSKENSNDEFELGEPLSNEETNSDFKSEKQEAVNSDKEIAEKLKRKQDTEKNEKLAKKQKNNARLTSNSNLFFSSKPGIPKNGNELLNEEKEAYQQKKA